MPTRPLALSSERRAAMASRRIFFGHNSVGGNLVAGIGELMAEDPEIGLRVVHSAEPWSVHGPALIETTIGVNGDPGGKGRAFSAAMAHGLDEPGAVAFFKYCYLDVGANTDPDALFAEYRGQMTELKKRHPLVVFAHVTMPLMAYAEPRAVQFAKRLLGRQTAIALNRKRNRFNELLRAEYAGREPVFDLAELESTHPDGSRAYARYGSERVYLLAPEYTADGGHLTLAAQRMFGQRLLEFLAELPMPAPALAE